MSMWVVTIIYVSHICTYLIYYSLVKNIQKIVKKIYQFLSGISNKISRI